MANNLNNGITPDFEQPKTIAGSGVGAGPVAKAETLADQIAALQSYQPPQDNALHLAHAVGSWGVSSAPTEPQTLKLSLPAGRLQRDIYIQLPSVAAASVGRLALWPADALIATFPVDISGVSSACLQAGGFAGVKPVTYSISPYRNYARTINSGSDTDGKGLAGGEATCLWFRVKQSDASYADVLLKPSLTILMNITRAELTVSGIDSVGTNSGVSLACFFAVISKTPLKTSVVG